jgi:hypothetical protein
MATSAGKARCVICDKKKATLKCGGCFQEFCFQHMKSHRQTLNKQLDEIEFNRDIFRQSLTQQIEQPNNHILIQQIDEWEKNSIKNIQQTAEEKRQILLTNINEYSHQIIVKLNDLTSQLQRIRQENDFNEIALRQFDEQLKLLTKELTNPPHISIKNDSQPLINKISIDVSSKSQLFLFQSEIL